MMGPVAPTAEYESYLRGLWRSIVEVAAYPQAARRRELTGTVLVELILHPTGRIEEVKVVGSSSHRVLDNAALEAVRAVRALPFPAHLPRRVLRVEFPIVFELQ
jgi:protein TonB